MQNQLIFTNPSQQQNRYRLKPSLRPKRKRTKLTKTKWPPAYEKSSYEEQRAAQFFHGRDLTSCPPYKTLRFFEMYTSNPLLQSIFYSNDKTYSEWKTIVSKYKEYAAIFPFLSEVYVQLQDLYFKHMRIRMLLQKFVRTIKLRIVKRRVIGSIDLYTTIAVPKHAQICIHDYASKSLYTFHTQTAIRICGSALKYSNYGIPFPQIPKNPYTNIPFTYGQLVSMVQQIFMNCAYSNSLPPINLVSFRECELSVETYKIKNIHALNIEAAKSLLFDFHDTNSRYYYMEVLDDAIESEDLRAPRWNIIKPYIHDRSIPEPLLKRLDSLVLSLFLYQNHSICYTYGSYDKMLLLLEILHNDIAAWWKTYSRLGVTAMNAVAAGTESQNLTHV